MLTGCVVGKDAKDLFFEVKGVLEEMARSCHMEDITLEKIEKPVWADVNGYLNILKDGEIIGSMGLLSLQVMNAAKIKRCNVCMFEVNSDKFVALDSRENVYERLSELPLVEKDLSILVDEDVKWIDIHDSIKKFVKEVEFVDEYHGDQVPAGKKSITLKVKILNEGTTMTSEEINSKTNHILKVLNKTCGAELRTE